jgi:hypothetical protein
LVNNELERIRLVNNELERIRLAKGNMLFFIGTYT